MCALFLRVVICKRKFLLNKQGRRRIAGMENYRYILVFFCMLSILSTQVIALKFDLSTLSKCNVGDNKILSGKFGLTFFLKENEMFEKLFQNSFSS